MGMQGLWRLRRDLCLTLTCKDGSELNYFMYKIKVAVTNKTVKLHYFSQMFAET